MTFIQGVPIVKKKYPKISRKISEMSPDNRMYFKDHKSKIVFSINNGLNPLKIDPKKLNVHSATMSLQAYRSYKFEGDDFK